VVLYFGFIKAYKGVVHLIAALPRLRERYGDGIRVAVVGDVYGDGEVYAAARRAAACEDILVWRDGYAPDEEVEDWFLAADVVALPGVGHPERHRPSPTTTTSRSATRWAACRGRAEGETGAACRPDALAAALIRFFDEDRGALFSAAVARARRRYCGPHGRGCKRLGGGRRSAERAAESGACAVLFLAHAAGACRRGCLLE
jgi:hypothetical protein